MAIITAGNTQPPNDGPVFRTNGSIVTLKKISETDWILFGDLAEGDSEGFGSEITVPENSLVFQYDSSVGSPFQIVLSGASGEVYWGYGEKEEIHSGYISVNPPDNIPPGVYTGYIAGTAQDVSFNTPNTDPWLTKILSFGDLGIPSLSLSGCTNLIQVPEQIPRSFRYLNGMFLECGKFNQDISGWDVSNIESMDFAFMNASSFNQDLSGWCVSSIPSEPSNFSTGTTSWALPKPIWGTCPA